MLSICSAITCWGGGALTGKRAAAEQKCKNDRRIKGGRKSHVIPTNFFSLHMEVLTSSVCRHVTVGLLRRDRLVVLRWDVNAVICSACF